MSRQSGCGAMRRAMRSLPLVALLATPLTAWPQEARAPLDPELERVARAASASVFTVFAVRDVDEPVTAGPASRQRFERRRLTRVGTGVFVDSGGDILTTASVVLGAERLSVRAADGTQVDAVLVGVDPVANVALLRARGVRAAPLPFARPTAARLGTRVLTLGTSFRAQPTRSLGVITQRHADPRHSLLQISNPVYPGNSGAAALTAGGELIGIVQGELGSPTTETAAERGERRQAGAGLVLPVETLAAVLEQLRSYGRVPQGFLGLQTRALSIESETERGARVPLGALVENVVPGSPAARGGLGPGDLIVGFEGERVEYPGQLARWIAGTRPGTGVELIWVRHETRQAGRFTLTESQAPPTRWIMPQRAPGESAPLAGKIQELEQQIQRLSRELELLKIQAAPR